MNGLLINARGLAISNRALVATSGENPCCCGAAGCCDSARRLRVCPDGVSEYCCDCGQENDFEVSYRRERVVQVIGWGGNPGVPGDRRANGDGTFTFFPGPPQNIYLRESVEYKLKGQVRCVNGVRTTTWLLPTFLETRFSQWLPTEGRYLETNVLLTDPLAFGVTGQIPGGGLRNDRWCGTNFNDFLQRQYIGFGTNPAQGLWTHCSGRVDFRVATNGAVFPIGAGDTGNFLEGYQRWDGTLTCTRGELNEEVAGDYLQGTPFGGSYTFAKETTFTTASWSLTPMGDCPTRPCEPVVPGACCRSSNPFSLSLDPCLVISRQLCGQLAGSYRGDGTDCAFANCPPLGGCCLPGGGCIETTQPQCLVRAGQWKGAGVRCDATLCAGPTGACCINGQCLLTGKQSCLDAGGDYKGDNVPCVNGICPPEPPRKGACCLPDGSCVPDTTQAGCMAKNGVWRTDAPCSRANCRPVIIIPPPGNDRLPISPAALGGGCSSCGGGESLI